MSKQIILVIFDGWGIYKKYPGNAIENANKPFFDYLWKKYPHAKFQASGEAIGLPPGNIGSSEIAHTIIGAGAIIDTDLVRLNKLSEADQIDLSPAIQEAFNHARKFNSVLHLCGQVSPGGVHSHQNHLFALLKAAKRAGLEKVAIHVFTDGRDMPPTSGHQFVKELEDEIEKIGIGFIATLQGRYYAMDRNDNWDRLKLVEEAMFNCEGRTCDINPSQMMKSLYQEGEEDEFIKPLVFLDKDGNKYPVSKNDSVIAFNFRPDRMRMLDKKIIERKDQDNLCFVTLTEHDPRFECLVAYPPMEIKTTLANEISKAGLTQAHITETEKYAHLVYFLNGGRDDPFPNEEDILIESRRDIPTHDLAPEMKAKEITDKAIEKLDEGIDFIAINYANADMIGHTGNYEATVKAIEALDIQLKRLVEHAQEKGAVVFITADHGNAEMEINEENGEKITAHTTNLVPAILTSNDYKLKDGGLADIAPTILELFGIEKPEAMTGKSLLNYL